MRVCSIDRIEEEFAVLLFDDGEERTINKSLLPPGISEGAVLNEKDGTYETDENETALRREKATGLLKKILEKHKEQ